MTTKTEKKKGKKSKEVRRIGFEADDYLVVTGQDGKRYCGKAIGQTLLSVAGMEDEVRFHPEDVLANLGRTPEPGASVYGLKVDRVLKKITIKHLTSKIEVRTKLKATSLEEVETAIQEAVNDLRNRRLLPCEHMIPSLHLCKKSAAGYTYTKRFKGGEHRDVLIVSADPVEAHYAFYEAWGAHVWEHMINSDVRVKWMNLLHKMRSITAVDEQELTDLLATYQRQTEPDLKGLHNLMQDENASYICKAIISFFKTVHGLTASEVDMMCRQDSVLIGQMWPQWTAFSAMRVELPTHARRNARSLFAYAFACHARGAIPKSLDKAITFTLKKLSPKHE